MTRDVAHRNMTGAEDDARTEEAKRVIEDYAKALREIVQKLRRLIN